MALTPGARLGVYEIIASIGVGGMGEVYRATDTTLGRQVAIKILPDAFASDPERLARFEREAKTLASLNHPHIAAIYGFKKSAGMHALVMELVEGPTLADRVAQGPISLDEALPIARQIAEALEAAHEQGIIHRDLKPANIKVRSDGTVKVLDFGLAKAMEPTGAMSPNVSQSPTITTPAMTQAGMILGTAAYMSPEQAKGRTVDKRSDVWAFGCVLYEMLTGRRAFDGEDMTEVLGAVVRLEPNWEALSSDVPQPVRTLLQRCLVKDRRSRIGDIAVAFFVLNHQAGVAAISTASAAPPPRRSLLRRVATVTVGVPVAAVVAATFTWLVMRPAAPRVTRTTVTTSAAAAMVLQGSDRDVAITPDGSRIVYRGNNQLLVRALDQLEPTVLDGLGAPQGVFTSPDGQWVGFFDGVQLLKKVAITGGPPVTIGSVDGGGPRGATWGPDGTIVYSTNAPSTGLQRVSAEGGQPTVLTKPDRERGEGDHTWPEFLPGGQAVLFTITTGTGGIDPGQVALLDLQTGTSKVLIRGGSHAHFVPTGHLVYGVNGTLRAVAFDLGRLEVVGTAAPVLDGVVTTTMGATDFGVAANGSLVYVPGGAGAGGQQTVVSVDRQGGALPLAGLPTDSYRDVRVSPDGKQLALATLGDIWTYDLARGGVTRLTTDPARDASPVWTPNGERIIFTSSRRGYRELFWRRSDGTGNDEPLLARAKDLLDLRVDGWSPDGSQLLFSEVSPNVESAIGQMTIERPSDAKLLVKGENAAVSPDGRWIAYQSYSPGNPSEIYVERYPELGNRQQISTGGGRIPLWSRTGRELFFRSLDSRQILAVPVQSGTTLVAGRQQMLFEFAMLPLGGSARPYDIAPDGRFLIIRSAQTETGGGPPSNLILVQNWFEELKRLVPPK